MVKTRRVDRGFVYFLYQSKSSDTLGLQARLTLRQIYTLEKVLRLKRDGASKLPFLDEALKYLDSKPTQMFWLTTARCLETQARDASKSTSERMRVILPSSRTIPLDSTFIQQTLSNGYPRLLRLFHDFFSKIALHTDTIYMQSYQR